MATVLPNDVEFDPMTDSIENLLIRTAKEDPVSFKKNTFKPFVFFGERIPYLHRAGLYLHLTIVCLQYFFYINTQVIVDFTLDNITLEYPLTEQLFHNDFSKPFLSSLPYLLIPFIVYFCDRQMIRRYYLAFSSTLMGFIASCILLILLLLKHFERESIGGIISGNRSSSIVVDVKYFVDAVGYSFCALSYILFSFSYALSFPFSIIFGLDILHGTQYEMMLLYFSLFYISKNIGALVSYLAYAVIIRDFPYIHCAVTTLVILIALLLMIVGRLKGYFEDSAIVANNFSFYKGLKVFIGACNLKLIRRNKSDFKSLMVYASRKKGYTNSHQQVDRILGMVKINFTLIILIPLLGSYQILYQLFPEQSSFLYFLVFPIETNKNYYCKSSNYFLSYWFINPLTIIILAPFIEYLFYDIIFDNKRHDLPCWVNCISLRIGFIRKNCAFQFRERLRKHFTLIDPILKRVFWGLPFGLFSAICALIVEVLRTQFTVTIECDQDSYSLGSVIPLISQIPQYIFSGILEAISAIGLLQYTYYLCSRHFQNSLKGFFFSLFFFYYGVAGVISNIFNMTLDQICSDHCNNSFNVSVSTDTASSWCLLDTSDCKTSFQKDAWAIWVIVIILYLIMIPLFYAFSHNKHWEIVRGGEREDLSEVTCLGYEDPPSLTY